MPEREWPAWRSVSSPSTTGRARTRRRPCASPGTRRRPGSTPCGRASTSCSRPRPPRASPSRRPSRSSTRSLRSTLVAAHTSTIKVASGIIELPLHHPVSLAKQLASVDQVAAGPPDRRDRRRLPRARVRGDGGGPGRARRPHGRAPRRHACALDDGRAGVPRPLRRLRRRRRPPPADRSGRAARRRRWGECAGTPAGRHEGRTAGTCSTPTGNGLARRSTPSGPTSTATSVRPSSADSS